MITIKELIDENKNKKILNMGCGKKQFKKKEIVNLDSKKEVNPDVIHNINVFPYPFKENEFDIVWCSNILMYSKEFIKTIEEIHRITKPNGLIYVTEPYWNNKDIFTDRLSYKGFTEHSFMYFEEKNKLNYYTNARLKKEKINYEYTKLGKILPFKRITRYVLNNIVSKIQFKLRVIK